jgi:hypothetical protein
METSVQKFDSILNKKGLAIEFNVLHDILLRFCLFYDSILLPIGKLIQFEPEKICFSSCPLVDFLERFLLPFDEKFDSILT